MNILVILIVLLFTTNVLGGIIIVVLSNELDRHKNQKRGLGEKSKME